MISKIKKNKIDLFRLKKKNDLLNVELFFSNFLKKLFKHKKKYFYKNRFCACGSQKISQRVKIGFFSYNKCFCGSYYISPMIKDKTLSLIYSDSGPYSLYRKKFIENKSKIKIRSKKVNKRKFDQVLAIIRNKNKSLLDFGCGDGGFLKVCKSHGMKNLSGVDSKYLKRETYDGIHYYNSLDNLNKNNKFNCITLWGVLEHLSDPVNFLKKISNYLSKNGFIFLEIPNAESLLMNYAITNKKLLSRFLEPGRHLYFFSKKFISIVSQKFNLKLIDLETNGLDLQTIIGPTNKKLTNKILDLQTSLDSIKASDHLRFVLQKI